MPPDFFNLIEFLYLLNQVAPATQTPSQPNTSRTPAKGVLHQQYSGTVAPQTPPKKAAPVGRGVPPPIPPNKPVIPSKQTPSRRADAAELDKKKPSLVGTKEATNQAAPVEPGRGAQPGIEMLGQELADFQQMFVTMATSNNT